MQPHCRDMSYDLALFTIVFSCVFSRPGRMSAKGRTYFQVFINVWRYLHTSYSAASISFDERMLSREERKQARKKEI